MRISSSNAYESSVGNLQKRQSAAACQEKLATRLTRLQKVAPEPKPESTV
jgi:hypothetical protein